MSPDSTNIQPDVGELLIKRSGEAWVYVGRGRFKRSPEHDTSPIHTWLSVGPPQETPDGSPPPRVPPDVQYRAERRYIEQRYGGSKP